MPLVRVNWCPVDWNNPGLGPVGPVYSAPGHFLLNPPIQPSNPACIIPCVPTYWCVVQSPLSYTIEGAITIFNDSVYPTPDPYGNVSAPVSSIPVGGLKPITDISGELIFGYVDVEVTGLAVRTTTVSDGGHSLTVTTVIDGVSTTIIEDGGGPIGYGYTQYFGTVTNTVLSSADKNNNPVGPAIQVDTAQIYLPIPTIPTPAGQTSYEPDFVYIIGQQSQVYSSYFPAIPTPQTWS